MSDDLLAAIGKRFKRRRIKVGDIHLHFALGGPIIDYNPLADPSGRPRMMQGVKLARRVAQTAPLAALIDHETSPGISIAATPSLQNRKASVRVSKKGESFR